MFRRLCNLWHLSSSRSDLRCIELTNWLRSTTEEWHRAVREARRAGIRFSRLEHDYGNQEHARIEGRITELERRFEKLAELVFASIADIKRSMEERQNE